jgi:hypothetical protein
MLHKGFNWSKKHKTNAFLDICYWILNFMGTLYAFYLIDSIVI